MGKTLECYASNDFCLLSPTFTFRHLTRQPSRAHLVRDVLLQEVLTVIINIILTSFVSKHQKTLKRIKSGIVQVVYGLLMENGINRFIIYLICAHTHTEYKYQKYVYPHLTSDMSVV